MYFAAFDPDYTFNIGVHKYKIPYLWFVLFVCVQIMGFFLRLNVAMTYHFGIGNSAFSFNSMRFYRNWPILTHK